MSNINTGVEIRHALVRSFTWGQAAQAGTGDGLEITGHTLSHRIESIPDNSLGRAHSYGAGKGNTKLEGGVDSHARYSDLLPLALVAGSSPAPAASGTITYTHTITPADNIDGVMATLVEKRKSYLLEMVIKPYGFTLSGEAGRAMSLRLDTLGFDLVEDSTVNTLSTFANVTIPDTSNRVLFADSVIRINSATGPALGAGDLVYPNRIEFTYRRSVAGVYTGQYAIIRGGAVTDRIDEPVNSGSALARLKLHFPTNSDAVSLTDFKADTRKKIDITFTGRQIETGLDYRLLVELPHAELVNVAVLDSARGRIVQSAEFALHIPDTTVQGMSGVTTPWRVTGVNKKSTAYLV